MAKTTKMKNYSSSYIYYLLKIFCTSSMAWWKVVGVKCLCTHWEVIITTTALVHAERGISVQMTVDKLKDVSLTEWTYENEVRQVIWNGEHMKSSWMKQLIMIFFCQSLIGWDHLIFWIGSSKIKFMDINWKRYKIKIKRIKIRSRLVVRKAIYFDRCIPHFDLPRRGKQLKRCSDAFGYILCRSSNFQSCIEIPSCPLNAKRTPVCVGALW